MSVCDCLEVEFGVTDRLMMAIYLNSSQTTSGTGTGTTTARVNGTSIEAKYKLADAVADPVGLALYGEVVVAVCHAGGVVVRDADRYW